MPLLGGYDMEHQVYRFLDQRFPKPAAPCCCPSKPDACHPARLPAEAHF